MADQVESGLLLEDTDVSGSGEGPSPARSAKAVRITAKVLLTVVLLAVALLAAAACLADRGVPARLASPWPAREQSALVGMSAAAPEPKAPAPEAKGGAASTSPEPRPPANLSVGKAPVQKAQIVAKPVQVPKGVPLGASCLTNHHCLDAGYQCFTKNEYWAQCLIECIPGPNPLDQVSPMPWACQALGNRTPGVAQTCSALGENCMKTKCCKEPGTQCYAKGANFATCKPSCVAGPQMQAPDWDEWTCEELGPRAMGVAPWVAQQCSLQGQDCSKTMCCATPGHQCFLQSQYWGTCKPDCTVGAVDYPGSPPWECTTVGTRTPNLAGSAGEEKGQVAAWVPKRCSAIFEDCSSSHCCQAVNHQCFRKNKYWATCRESCSTDPDPNDGNKSWTCETLGPRSWGLAVRGFPSLYCVTLYMPSRYEGPLLRSHLNASVGIFACDGYDVFASQNDTLGNMTVDDILVQAVLIPQIEVGVSQDGTAGNAKLFMAVWDKVIASGRFKNYDWTIKVDPDAVIIPWRVRNHMAPHTNENVYVVNCNKVPGSPNFPMMFGAVEIFSRIAMYAYASGSWRCGQQLPWGSWGEDYYMTHCLDFLGVGRIADFGVLGDNVCTGANCADPWTASFHPFKDQGSWFQCWTTATR